VLALLHAFGRAIVVLKEQFLIFSKQILLVPHVKIMFTFSLCSGIFHAGKLFMRVSFIWLANGIWGFGLGSDFSAALSFDQSTIYPPQK
jgi:hypothetical protein